MQESILKIAPPYTTREIESIEQRFQKLLGEPIRFTVIEDTSLIGGFSAFIGGKVYDASILAQLSALRSNLNR